MEGEVVFVLRDFHQCWQGQARVIRKLRNLAQKLKYTRKTIVVTTPEPKIPEELKDDMVLLEFSLPGVPELEGILKKLTGTPGVRVNLTPQGWEKVVRSALGFSSNQAQRVFAKAIVSDGVLDERDIDLITAEKKQIIRESGALEFFAPTETIADVGGLEVLKEWLRTREAAFSQEARDYGLPEPKGIALIGIPGTGKSLTAKMIAGLWRLPLIRLDVGALFGGLVGQSEENTRRALALAEIFFLDLPTRLERREIFEVHLRKRRRPLGNFDLERLAAASEGYVGAEIEQAVIDAMYIAYSDRASPGRDFTTEDILSALSKQVPMSRSQREAVGALRQWLAEGRAQSASFLEARQAQEQFVQIQIDPHSG